jgi:hypothetical protein
MARRLLCRIGAERFHSLDIRGPQGLLRDARDRQRCFRRFCYRFAANKREQNHPISLSYCNNGEPVGIRTRDLLIKSRANMNRLTPVETDNIAQSLGKQPNCRATPFHRGSHCLPDFATPFATPPETH